MTKERFRKLNRWLFRYLLVIEDVDRPESDDKWVILEFLFGLLMTVGGAVTVSSLLIILNLWCLLPFGFVAGYVFANWLSGLVLDLVKKAFDIASNYWKQVPENDYELYLRREKQKVKNTFPNLEAYDGDEFEVVEDDNKPPLKLKRK